MSIHMKNERVCVMFVLHILSLRYLFIIILIGSIGSALQVTTNGTGMNERTNRESDVKSIFAKAKKMVLTRGKKLLLVGKTRFSVHMP